MRKIIVLAAAIILLTFAFDTKPCKADDEEAFIGEYSLEWYGEQIELSIDKVYEWTKTDKGETFEIARYGVIKCFIRYADVELEGHFVRFEDDLMIQINTADDGYGLYYIEKLESGDIWLKLFDATYTALVDDEMVMSIKKG